MRDTKSWHMGLVSIGEITKPKTLFKVSYYMIKVTSYSVVTKDHDLGASVLRIGNLLGIVPQYRPRIEYKNQSVPRS